MKKAGICMFFLTLISVLLCGCGDKEEGIKKLRDMEFTVATEEALPEELKTNLEAQKEKEFKITYMDKDYLYIGIGYGKQESGGYSITVNELYLTENAIYVNTNLCGPTQEEQQNKAPSYPYIVIKTEILDTNVVFE